MRICYYHKDILFKQRIVKTNEIVKYIITLIKRAAPLKIKLRNINNSSLSPAIEVTERVE